MGLNGEGRDGSLFRRRPPGECPLTGDRARSDNTNHSHGEMGEAFPALSSDWSMKILSLQEHDGVAEFEAFLDRASEKLAAAICRKLQAYAELGDIYSCNSLKILNPRIWGYKGTIYKLRVDAGKESARVLFVKTADNDIALLHGFIKKTRKTPNKDARIAKDNFQRLKNNAAMTHLPLTKYLI